MPRTAEPNYGVFYMKADNLAYAKGSDGVEHALNIGPADYAEMGNIIAGDEILHSADEWHALFNANIVAGLISGFTFVAGKEGTGNITTAGGGAAINIADASAPTGTAGAIRFDQSSTTIAFPAAPGMVMDALGSDVIT